MSCRNILIAAIALLFLCSCGTLVSPHYVGEPAPVFSDDLVERAWYFGGHVWHVKPTSNHEAIASTLTWHYGDELFEQDEIELLLTELGDGVFLNIKQDDNYTIFRLLPAFSVGCEFALITVNSAKVSQDIANGKIEGGAKANLLNAFTLNGNKHQLDRYVEANLDTLFDLDLLIIGTPIPRGPIVGFHDAVGC